MSVDYVKDDPVRPYKMYAGVVSAALTSLITDTALDWSHTVVALLTAAVAGLAVYMTPNPKVAS